MDLNPTAKPRLQIFCQAEDGFVERVPLDHGGNTVQIDTLDTQNRDRGLPTRFRIVVMFHQGATRVRTSDETNNDSATLSAALP